MPALVAHVNGRLSRGLLSLYSSIVAYKYLYQHLSTFTLFAAPLLPAWWLPAFFFFSLVCCCRSTRRTGSCLTTSYPRGGPPRRRRSDCSSRSSRRWSTATSTTSCTGERMILTKKFTAATQVLYLVHTSTASFARPSHLAGPSGHRVSFPRSSVAARVM